MISSIHSFPLLALVMGLMRQSKAFQPPNVVNYLYLHHHQSLSNYQYSNHGSHVILNMATKQKKKKKATKKGGSSSSGGGGAGLRGFGSVASNNKSNVQADRSKEARLFYDFLEKGGAGDNLNRCALGTFPLPGGEGSIRGVVALKEIKKGEVIINIPYEMAINLGLEGSFAAGPAATLLRDYCETLSKSTNDGNKKEEEDVGVDQVSSKGTPNRKSYYEMLPPYMGNDCLSSCDFFSPEALEALQSPLVQKETLARKAATENYFKTHIATEESNFPNFIDGTPITSKHLLWAVWLITSRVLTVQGEADSNKSYRLMIPFLDMCNHDRSSPHVLSGRAVPGGELKVVAGANVQPGDQINICYGGGVAGNDRFIQDYGFLDESDNNNNNQGFDMVALQILGKRRILEGANAGRYISEQDKEETLQALRKTTMAHDEGLLLQTNEGLDVAMRSAIQYRLGVKKALSKYIIMT